MQLHGQHLAQELVLTTVRSYLELPRPDKALALSFHGWSGTGKNFVARLLAENLYRDGLRSDCVKVFITLIHFPHPKYVDLYKVRPAVLGWNEVWAAPLCWGWGLGAILTEPVTHKDIHSTQVRPGHVEERHVPNTTHPKLCLLTSQTLSLNRESIC